MKSADLPCFGDSLCGSEPNAGGAELAEGLLSCLRGSEPAALAAVGAVDFLSCLRGSEPMLRLSTLSAPIEY
ncbi:MAG: hypothetical protein Q7S97_12665 [Polaromonas sp.]|nr:hypothetical protein [Polaromonas sp.]